MNHVLQEWLPLVVGVAIALGAGFIWSASPRPSNSSRRN